MNTAISTVSGNSNYRRIKTVVLQFGLVSSESSDFIPPNASRRVPPAHKVAGDHASQTEVLLSLLYNIYARYPEGVYSCKM